MEKVKVVQIGCGKMSKYIMRYVYEKNGEIVGAVDVSPKLIGKDISEVADIEYKGVSIEDVAGLDALLKRVKPQVAIITTMSFLNEIKDVLRICIKNGVHALTTCEEAFFAANSNPEVFDEIDSLARAYHVSVVGCGYQDIFWGNMISNICASTQKITKIKGSSSYNVEDYGLALAKAHGAGLTKEDFEREIATYNGLSEEKRQELMSQKSFFPSYMWNVVGWLAYKLGLHITKQTQECIPVMCETPLHSDTLELDLPKGSVRGMRAVVRATTKENTMLEVECIGKVYTPSENDYNEWCVFGEPTTKVFNDSPATVELTCADVVNRIPQVLRAKSGFISTADLEEPKFITDINKFS
ncbi:MAG: dihydrodipicolinate reductase [Bacilli bacterium]|nr:dihydrodipicolinate reductase [Bacilli bacterium]MBR1748755.1 dihydrodipicolinate reductase [Bacilli bacterium]MBR1817246.1 dihydrodipicolinate reductase [Bacilli bacterium]